jgi:hypothetical protein
MATAVVPPTCKNGHALTAAVVVYWGSRRPHCRTCQNLASLAYHRRLREEAIHHYGGACACCGETELAFLAIDHIEGGGQAHRQAIGWGGSNLYGWLHRMGCTDRLSMPLPQLQRRPRHVRDVPPFRAPLTGWVLQALLSVPATWHGSRASYACC